MAKRKARKNPNGAGSIFPIQGGKRWRAVITIQSADGSSRKISRTGKSLQHAEMLLAELKGAHQIEKVFSGNTVGDAIDRWIRDFASQAEETTRVGFKYARKHLEILEPQDVEELQPLDVSDWLAGLADQGVGQEARRKSFKLLRQALSYSERLGQIRENPCRRVQPPKALKSKVFAYSESQMKTFLKSVKGDENELIYRLAFTLGMRQQEIFGLRIESVNLTAKTIRIERAIVEVEGRVEFKDTPKTDNSYRTLNMTPAIGDLTQVKVAIREAQGASQLDLLFVNQEGNPIRRSNFANRHWKPQSKQAGIPQKGLHAARHTAASVALSRGLSITKVAAWLGDTEETILRTYAHFIESDHSEAAETMSDF